MGFPMGTTVSYAESDERTRCGLRLIEKPTKHPRKVLDIQPQVVEASSMFKILKGGHSLSYTTLLFPGGEVSVRLTGDVWAFNTWRLNPAPHQTIVARLNDANDVMRLALLTDALRRIDPTPIRLFMPYVPYARQDRVCNPGESHSLGVFAELVNQMGFERVTVVDPHSDVTEAVFERLHVIRQLDVINAFLPLLATVVKDRVVFVSPDAGANKKTATIGGYFAHREFIRADKVRDLETGKIKETVVYGDITGQTVMILDDICDGGASFTALAKALKVKSATKVFLYITHGIFSKGINPLFEAGIDHVYTTDSFNELVGEQDGVTVLRLEDEFKTHL